MEYFYQVLNEKNEAVSGYNNTYGIYSRLAGAKQEVRRQEEMSRKYPGRFRGQGPFRIQRTPITWEDFSD